MHVFTAHRVDICLSEYACHQGLEGQTMRQADICVFAQADLERFLRFRSLMPMFHLRREYEKLEGLHLEVPPVSFLFPFFSVSSALQNCLPLNVARFGTLICGCIALFSPMRRGHSQLSPPWRD